MKRKIFAALLALLCLTGCGMEEDPYRVDTVIYIPADPTEAATHPFAQKPEEETVPEATESVAEAGTEPVPQETEPTETEPEPTEKRASSQKSTSKKSASTKKADKKKEEAKMETEPKATEPSEEKQAATEPPSTEAPATEAPETEAPATEPTDPPLYDISGYSVGTLEKNMESAINACRTEEGLEALSLSSRLCAIASCRGYEISQVWSHDRPDGRSYKTVLSDYGYGAGTVRELLVHVPGTGDADAIVDKWMNSDSYRELILGDFSKIGIGVYRADGITYLACLLVG